MKCPVCRGPMPDANRLGRPRKVCSDRCKHRAARRRARLSVHFRAGSVEWYTPSDVFERISASYGPFDLDPCADPRSPIWPLVPAHWTAADDGLVQPWYGRVFCNPPYGDAIPLWFARASRAVSTGEAALVALLVPARTDTTWWHDATAAGARAELWRGRIRFLRPVTEPDGTTVLRRGAGAAFPSAVVVFRRVSTATNPPAPPPPVGLPFPGSR